MDTFLFDLDGTLLPMEQDEFVQLYFQALGKKMVPYGIEQEELVRTAWKGTKSMIENDGTMMNQQRFWDAFISINGDEARELEPVFDDFYRNEFNMARAATKTDPAAAKIIKTLKNKGYLLVLATNPVFPRVATFNRIRWAGLSPEDFIHITTYENSSFCKPNPKYYNEILSVVGKEPCDCIMVGNDVAEDMCSSEIGLDTFLLKNCLINRTNSDIGCYKQGYFKDLLEFIYNLPDIAG